MYQYLVGAILSLIMVISSVLLTWRWFSVIHGYTDPYVILYAFLLTVSLSLLILNALFIMNRTIREIESAKRLVSISYREIDERVERKIAEGLRDLEKRVDEMKRLIYR